MIWRQKQMWVFIGCSSKQLGNMEQTSSCVYLKWEAPFYTGHFALYWNDRETSEKRIRCRAWITFIWLVPFLQVGRNCGRRNCSMKHDSYLIETLLVKFNGVKLITLILFSKPISSDDWLLLVSHWPLTKTGQWLTFTFLSESCQLFSGLRPPVPRRWLQQKQLSSFIFPRFVSQSLRGVTHHSGWTCCYYFWLTAATLSFFASHILL